MGPAEGDGQPVASVGTHDGVSEFMFTQLESPSPQAFRPVVLLVRWKPLGEGSVVRADTFTAAFDVRPAGSLLGEVAFARVLDQASASVVLTATSDATALSGLVDAFNALHGSQRPPFLGARCAQENHGPVTITFHEEGGGIVVATFDPYCFGQVEVSRDGVKLDPTLDPGDLDASLQGLIPHAVPAAG
jgi:hypothetical protein